MACSGVTPRRLLRGGRDLSHLPFDLGKIWNAYGMSGQDPSLWTEVDAQQDFFLLVHAALLDLSVDHINK